MRRLWSAFSTKKNRESTRGWHGTGWLCYDLCASLIAKYHHPQGQFLWMSCRWLVHVRLDLFVAAVIAQIAKAVHMGWATWTIQAAMKRHSLNVQSCLYEKKPSKTTLWTIIKWLQYAFWGGNRWLSSLIFVLCVNSLRLDYNSLHHPSVPKHAEVVSMLWDNQGICLQSNRY